MEDGRSAEKMSVGRGPRPRGGVCEHLVFLLSVAVLAATTGGSFGQGAGINEIGPEDLRVSHMGPDGDTAYGTFLGWPAIDWIALNDRSYCIVWAGDDLLE